MRDLASTRGLLLNIIMAGTLKFVLWGAVPALFVMPVFTLSSAAAQTPSVDHSATVGGAFTAAAIAALGWIAAYFLTGWRDDRTKRLQLEIEHAATQIKDFYAPLVALTDQLNTTVDVLDSVRNGKVDAEYHKLTGLIYDRFFLPIHEEINVILKTKVHLLEGANIPPSFIKYFAHYATEKAYWNLAGLGENVSMMRIPPYPPEFYDDVRSGYETVINRYEDALQELRQRRWLFNFNISDSLERWRGSSGKQSRVRKKITGPPTGDRGDWAP